ncbi:MAG: TRAP transporter small permease subunit [Dehalococcoidia bacterium]|nr:MAG: TRAP transporter small permease subunit [Dehalococcoidia bacterium]
MKWLRLTLRRIDSFSDIFAKSICWLILVLMACTFYDVIMRYFFNSPTIWAYSLVGQLFGPLWLLTGAYLLTHDEHVRMDIFYRRFSPRKKAIIDIITYTLFLFYIILILKFGWNYFWLSFIREEHLRAMWKPLIWPFKLAIPVGMALILIAGIAKYIRDFHLAITGRALEE